MKKRLLSLLLVILPFSYIAANNLTYEAVKRHPGRLYGMAFVNPGYHDAMLSEISQSQKDRHGSRGSNYAGLKSCQIRRDRRYNGGCPRLLGGRVENSCLMATEFQLWVLKKFWRWLVVIVTQHCECV